MTTPHRRGMLAMSTVMANGRDPDGARRMLSPTLFGIVLLCFLLPFVTVECGEAVTFRGVHAATGIDRPAGYSDHAAPVVWALIAFASAWAGLLVGLLRGRMAGLGGAVAGFVGIVGLVGFIGYVTGVTYGNVVPRIGYLLSVYLFLGAVVLNDYLLTRQMPALSDEAALWGPRRVYATAMTAVAALLLLTWIGAEFLRGSSVHAGHFEFEWWFWFFSLGVLIAAFTALGGVIHALTRRDPRRPGRTARPVSSSGVASGRGLESTDPG